MAWTVNASNSTTTDGTEQVLVNDTTTVATFQFAIDTVNMAAGDTIELRIYKTPHGGTNRVVYKQAYSGAQSVDDLIKISPAVGSADGIKVTLKRTAGTDRAYRWELLQV